MYLPNLVPVSANPHEGSSIRKRSRLEKIFDASAELVTNRNYSTTMAADYLAFDLGAESGRAMLGRLSSNGRSGRLELTELHRFPNHPLHEDGSLRWDIHHLWVEMQRSLALAPQALQSIGVDTWGVDFALLDAGGKLLENPYHYRDPRTEGMM